MDFELTLTKFCELLGFENIGAIHDSKNPAIKPEGFNAPAYKLQVKDTKRQGTPKPV